MFLMTPIYIYIYIIHICLAESTAMLILITTVIVHLLDVLLPLGELTPMVLLCKYVVNKNLPLFLFLTIVNLVPID
jgi:hypothetical protein